jgi:hypothetical protein
LPPIVTTGGNGWKIFDKQARKHFRAAWGYLILSAPFVFMTVTGVRVIFFGGLN